MPKCVCVSSIQSRILRLLTQKLKSFFGLGKFSKLFKMISSTSYVLSFSFIICIIQMIDVQHLFSKSLSISLVISISLCVLFCGSWCWWALTFQAMNTVLISYHHFFYSSLKLVRIFKALGNLFYMLSYNFVLKYSFQFCFLAIHSSAAAVLFNWA